MELETEKLASDPYITRLVSLNELIDRLSIFAPSVLYRESSSQNGPSWLDAPIPANRVAAALRGADLMPPLGEVFDDKYAKKILHRYLEIEVQRSWAAQQIVIWQTSLAKGRPSRVVFWSDLRPENKKSDPMKMWDETLKLLKACTAATQKALEVLKTGEAEDSSIAEAFIALATNSHTPRFIDIALSSGQALDLTNSVMLRANKIDAEHVSSLISSTKKIFPTINDSRYHDGALATIIKIVRQNEDFHNCTAIELKKYIKDELGKMSEAGDGKFYLGIKNREHLFKIKDEQKPLSSKELNIRIESVLHALSKLMSPAPIFAKELTPRHKK